MWLGCEKLLSLHKQLMRTGKTTARNYSSSYSSQMKKGFFCLLGSFFFSGFLCLFSSSYISFSKRIHFFVLLIIQISSSCSILSFSSIKPYNMIRRYTAEKYSGKSIDSKGLISTKSNLIYWLGYWLFDALQLMGIEAYLYSTIYEMNCSGVGRGVCNRCSRLNAACVAVRIPWGSLMLVGCWSTQIDPVLYVAAQKILDQAPIVATFGADDARRAAWIRKVLSLRKLMEQRERERPEEVGDLPAIRRQLGRLVNSMETLEEIARWVVCGLDGCSSLALTLLDRCTRALNRAR